jgi:hypothetical protein
MKRRGKPLGCFPHQAQKVELRRDRRNGMRPTTRPFSTPVNGGTTQASPAASERSEDTVQRELRILRKSLCRVGNTALCAVTHSLFPPTLCERRHRGFACRLVAMCCALDVAVVAARPHPGAALRRAALQCLNWCMRAPRAWAACALVWKAPTRAKSGME